MALPLLILGLILPLSPDLSPDTLFHLLAREFLLMKWVMAFGGIAGLTMISKLLRRRWKRADPAGLAPAGERGNPTRGHKSRPGACGPRSG